MKRFYVILTALICLGVFFQANLQSISKDTKLTKEKFNDAVKLLREHVLLLQVEYLDPSTNKVTTKKIEKYEDMTNFIKLKLQGKFTLLNQKTGDIIPVSIVAPSDQESKCMGQWVWKKICEAAEAGGIMKDCNGFFQWK